MKFWKFERFSEIELTSFLMRFDGSSDNILGFWHFKLVHYTNCRRVSHEIWMKSLLDYEFLMRWKTQISESYEFLLRVLKISTVIADRLLKYNRKIQTAHRIASHRVDYPSQTIAVIWRTLQLLSHSAPRSSRYFNISRNRDSLARSKIRRADDSRRKYPEKRLKSK